MRRGHPLLGSRKRKGKKTDENGRGKSVAALQTSKGRSPPSSAAMARKKKKKGGNPLTVENEGETCSWP